MTINCHFYYLLLLLSRTLNKKRNIHYLMNNVKETDIENYMYYFFH